MANQLESAITISEALNRIDEGEFLLPAIQRRFVWNTEQIEMLFDSMMQGYPINTFMFWEVKKDSIKNDFLFYDFLRYYVEYEGGNNLLRNTKGNYKNFYAVIDGQQRLNSLFIGLKGSYAHRKYVKHKKKYQPSDYPTRKLYLDILNPLENDEEKKVYDFRFLISDIHEQEHTEITKEIEIDGNQKEEVPCFWFEVGKILSFKSLSDIVRYVTRTPELDGNTFAEETLIKLYDLIHNTPLINFYLEKEQIFDKILYEFIRTNSGGTKLSFADLLMSIITAAWDDTTKNDGAREQIDKLVKDIRDYGFEVSQDFILKTCLVILADDVKFSLSNFNNDTIKRIKSNWSKLTSTIKAAFQLLRSLKFNEESLRSKNAVIPIIYYLFISEKYKEINKDNKLFEDKKIIKKYLHIVLLNKVFGGSSDVLLKSLKEIITNNHENVFPLESIKNKYSNSKSTKSFIISEEKVDSILKTNYGNIDSFYILALLFPDFDFDFKNPNIDHLHPKTSFVQKNLDLLENEEDKVFYHEHYNTILNLGLLSEEQNKSKNKSPLNTWLEQQLSSRQIRERLLIPENASCDFKDFRSFIEKRKELLKERIRNNIN